MTDRTAAATTATAPRRRISSSEEYTEAAAEYRDYCRAIVHNRKLGNHRRAAELARASLELEEALALYDATNGRR